MSKTCILVAATQPSLLHLSTKLHSSGFRLISTSDDVDSALRGANIKFDRVAGVKAAEQMLKDLTGEVMAIAEQHDSDVCNVEKVNFIRLLANTCQRVAVYVEAGDIQALPSQLSFLTSMKERHALAARAFSYCSKVDEKVAAGFSALLDSFDKKVLLVGSGGREHAIASKLAQSAKVSAVFVAPGNFGTHSEGKCRNIAIASDDIAGLVTFAKKEQVDLIVVGPEQPLVDGLADAGRREGILVFGPSQQASLVEASKAWSKDFMARHEIRTAAYRNFTSFEEARAYIEGVGHRVVVKASGLAAGKGVLLPLTKEEAIAGARSLLEEKAFGSAGAEIVVEEYIEGEEVSVLAFCDGETAKGMPPAQDHKRVFDHDQGLNTGGMGAYAPTPCITPAQYESCMEIVRRSVRGMREEGREFVGVLYAGFILTKQGPVVLEYNCRFGDPETQVLLPLLQTDLFEVLLACAQGRLGRLELAWSSGFCCTVVCAAPGYPESYPKGSLITGLAEAAQVEQTKVFHAGTAQGAGGCVTNGGRVLAISGLGDSLKEAVARAYQAVGKVSFEGMHYRRDIARRGLDRRVRLGVVGSTRGTDMQAIIDAIEAQQLQADIVLVVSNKSKAGILERANKHSLPSLFLSALNKTREEYDELVVRAFQQAGVDLVLMIGYMRIVSSVFVQAFPSRCLNVHPSLLPDFAGGMDSDVHAAVINAKKKQSGCTIHFVTEEVDGGPIVMQKECAVVEGETPESLKEKVQKLEGEAFLEAIELFRQGKLAPREVITYRAAGVDIDAGEALVDAIKPYCKATRREGCDAELGGFGGLFDLAQAGYLSDDTILVSGTDGVGTKLKIAQAVGKHDTVGIDLVAMCVNDILVCGAEPLFFLDYYATGALQVEEAAQVVKGIAEGCVQSHCALIGGETAEMAGMYGKGEYDLAGFSVGAVRRSELLPRNIMVGDVCIGLPSSGVHSNGYSLVRKCVEKSGLDWTAPAPFSPDQSLAEALLTPTKIYVKQLMPLIKRGVVKGMAHITGGGLLDNLPRILPDHIAAHVDIEASQWSLPPVFRWLQSIAHLPQSELLRTFNSGVGMVVVVAAHDAEQVLQELQPAMLLGNLIARPEGAESVIVKGELK